MEMYSIRTLHLPSRNSGWPLAPIEWRWRNVSDNPTHLTYLDLSGHLATHDLGEASSPASPNYSKAPPSSSSGWPSAFRCLGEWTRVYCKGLFECVCIVFKHECYEFTYFGVTLRNSTNEWGLINGAPAKSPYVARRSNMDFCNFGGVCTACFRRVPTNPK